MYKLNKSIKEQTENESSKALFQLPFFSFVCICGIGIYIETGSTIPVNIDHEETPKRSNGVVKDGVVE